MTRPTPAGTATLWRSTSRWPPPRPKCRVQALPTVSPAPRKSRPVSRRQAPARATSQLQRAARRRQRVRGGREESGEERLVFGDDDEDLPAAQVASAGATADPVKDYLKQIGKVVLLNAGQEVELAKRIEAGLFAEEKLAEGSGVLRPGQS